MLLGVSQGLFLSVSMRMIHDRNKTANRVLSILISMAVLMLFGRVIAYRIPNDWIWRFGILADTSIFLFGPLIYMYSRRLIFNDQPIFYLHWLHYIPAILHFCYYIWTLTFSLIDFNTLYFSGRLNLAFFVVETTGILSFLCYWIRTFGLIRNYSKGEKTELSFRQPVIKFLKFLLIAIAILLTLWITSFVSANLRQKTFKYINYEVMWTSIPLFIYVVGYFSLRQPQIFRIRVKSKSSKEKERLKPDQIQKFQKRLKYFMEEERVYLKPDITLKYLADKLDTSSNNLSWLLNQVHQESFYDYINKYRVKEFLKKIDQNEHRSHTILALALDVGFNSKSTFNRVFKSVMGTTPKEYLKTKEVA